MPNNPNHLPPDGGGNTGSNDALRASILTSHAMLVAYASCIVILALGVVALVITIGVLSFQHPEKAQSFWQLLMGLVVGLLVDTRGGAATVKALLKK